MIDIGTVLNKFDHTYDERNAQVCEYGIRFITTDGRLRTMRARKNVKSPKQALQSQLQPKAKTLFNLQRHGTLLLQDLDKEEARAVKVATICAFRDFNSSTWNNVRH